MSVRHDEVIDEHALNLGAEEKMLRGALRRAVEAGHTAQAAGLIQAQATLRNCALRLETYNVYDKRGLFQLLEQVVDYASRLCKVRKISGYDSKATKRLLLSAINSAHNNPGEPIKVGDKRAISN